MNNSSFVGLNQSSLNNSVYVCSGATKEEFAYFEKASHYIDGFGQAILCVIGIIGNCIAIPVLCSKKLDSVFYRLLVCLALSDNVYLICALLESFRSHLDVPWDIDTHTILYVHAIYPIHNIVLCCSIYITAAIAFERYMAVCKPVVYHNHMMRNGHSSWFRALIYYMIPVLLFCIIINIPKFMELEIEAFPNVEGVALKPTKLRLDANYIIYYHHYTRLLVTGLIPFSSLAFCNFNIYKSVKHRRKVGKNSNIGSENESENRQALLLVLIIFLFLICNTPRIFLTLKETFSVKQFKEDYLNGCQSLPLWILFTGSFSHIFLTFNSSMNFFLYCCMSSSFRDVLSSHCNIGSKLNTLIHFISALLPRRRQEETLAGTQQTQNTHVDGEGILMTAL
ncbi:FMRFamide receptor [Lepeophtheirus salmonis]|uniref:FMRFamide receptor n=1 Tax=Lepeophtheirus salmonis TaxID=72036 RepID=UPI001AEB656D|nr:FMRFamide receptor-like [Lepeophtheirus salmonis]